MRRWIISALIVCAALSQPLFCQEGELVLSADGAVEWALKNSLTLESDRLNLVLKERIRDTSWNTFIPKVTASASLARPNDPPTGYPPIIPAGPHIFTLGTNVSASLNLSMAQYYSIRQTLMDYDSGLLSLETARKKLDRDVRKNFYDLLLMEESIKLMQKNIDAAKSRYDIAKANYLNGLVDEYTQLAAQVGYENLKPAIDDLRNNYEIAILYFKMSAGIPLERPVRLQGSIEPEIVDLDIRSLIPGYLQNRLEVQALKASIATLENTRDLTASTLFPVLTLMLSLDPSFTRDPFTNFWFANTSSEWKQRTGNFAVALSVSLDALLPFSKTQTDLASLQTNIEKTKTALVQTLLAAEMDLRSIVIKLSKSGESLASLKKNLALAEKANAMGQQAYKAGLKDYSQIEKTELDLQSARFEIVKEKTNYIKGLIDLAYSLNINLEKIKEVNHE